MTLTPAAPSLARSGLRCGRLGRTEVTVGDPPSPEGNTVSVIPSARVHDFVALDNGLGLGHLEALLERRDRISSALLAIDSSDPPPILVDPLEDLAAAIPPEAEVRKDLAAFASGLDADVGVDAAFRDRIDRVKLQVAESFRADRRMLRTRRRAVVRRFPVRGREFASVIRVDSSEFEEVDSCCWSAGELLFSLTGRGSVGVRTSGCGGLPRTQPGTRKSRRADSNR